VNHLGDTNKMVGEDHIRDATKMVSDTPRTDAKRGFHDLDTAVDAEFSEQLERELNAANKTIRLQHELMTTAEKRGVDKAKEELNEANQRIKQLESENDALRADLLLWEEKEAKP
jgi:FtsZ-binding cell division protein ZapB